MVRNSRKKTVLSFLALVAVTALSILAFEVLARGVLSDDRKRRAYAETKDVFHQHRDHVRFDPQLGFALRPGLHYEVSNREYRIDITTNSAGLRDDEASLRDPGVLIVGDSFTFGSGVGPSETFASVLEDLVETRVLNAGVAGYGTLQELILAERLLESHASGAGTIILQFYGNDLEDNLGYAGLRNRPYLVRSEDGFRTVPPTDGDFERWVSRFENRRFPKLARDSYLVYLGVKAWRILTEPPVPEVLGTDRPDELDAFRYLANRLRDLGQDRRARVAILYAPRGDYWTGGRDVHDEIEAVGRALSIEVVDLRDTLGPEDYFFLDGHWKPSGHRKAAEALAARLRRD